MEDRAVGSPQSADGSRRLALLGAAFLGAALLCDAAWLTRSPGEQGGMAFGVRRLGLRVELSQAQFEAVAGGMAVAGLACVVTAFVAARRRHSSLPAGSPRGSCSWSVRFPGTVSSVGQSRAFGWRRNSTRPGSAATWSRRMARRVTSCPARTRPALPSGSCVSLVPRISAGAWAKRQGARPSHSHGPSAPGGPRRFSRRCWSRLPGDPSLDRSESLAPRSSAVDAANETRCKSKEYPIALPGHWRGRVYRLAPGRTPAGTRG